MRKPAPVREASIVILFLGGHVPARTGLSHWRPAAAPKGFLIGISSLVALGFRSLLQTWLYVLIIIAKNKNTRRRSANRRREEYAIGRGSIADKRAIIGDGPRAYFRGNAADLRYRQRDSGSGTRRYVWRDPGPSRRRYGGAAREVGVAEPRHREADPWRHRNVIDGAVTAST